MGKNYNQAVEFINSYVKDGDYYADYYVGITNDANRRLFDEHKVDKDKDVWCYCTTDSKATAQDVEEHYLALGMQGDTGGDNDDTTIVYCYKINGHTVESTD